MVNRFPAPPSQKPLFCFARQGRTACLHPSLWPRPIKALRDYVQQLRTLKTQAENGVKLKNEARFKKIAKILKIIVALISERCSMKASSMKTVINLSAREQGSTPRQWARCASLRSPVGTLPSYFGMIHNQDKTRRPGRR